MKSFLGLLLLSLSSVMWGQNGFNTAWPDKPVVFDQVTDGAAVVSGHWVDAGKKPDMAGPSVSQISCDHKICREEQANLVVIDNLFSMTVDHAEYAVERWNSKEIVAATANTANTDGTCHVRLTLKFDRVNKRVYWMQSITEPTTDRFCTAAGLTLELKGDTAWVK
jgi:hypothetical protein